MIFEWPVALWALLIVPGLVAAYVVVHRRRRQAVLAYARWRTGDAGAPASRIKTLVPPALFLVAVVALIGAAARPVAVISMMSLRDTVILAIDVSNSMMAADLEPTRLEAAKAAARAFIAEQPRTTLIGLVAFAGTALPVQRPTRERADLFKAIDRLQTQEGTALGSAILVSLQTLFPKELFETDPTADQPDAAALPDGRARQSEVGPPPAPPPAEKRAPGSETSAAIVLLSDGQATTGADPLEAAQRAADRGVRVFTVGIGTEQGEVVKFGGVSMRVQLDEDTLKKIADATLGRYFMAKSAEDLSEIYRDLNTRFVTETRETEVGALFVALAATAALLAATLSMLWFNRIL
jgi:Ca-activated chloride channel family protein